MHRRTLECVALVPFLVFVFGAPAQDTPARKKPGSDFTHPIYLAAVSSNKTPIEVSGVGDTSVRPDIVYILRLRAGQQLTATLRSSSPAAQTKESLTLTLVDGHATSFQDAHVIHSEPASIDRKQNPPEASASITYVAPETTDYFLVAGFQGAGVVFHLKATVSEALSVPDKLDCVSGPITSLESFTQDVPSNLISDLAIGDSAKPEDDHNRRFCMTDCKIRPPTSLVLTAILNTAFSAKKEVAACWDESNTISRVTLP
ncbi:MAG: hypothetical protein WA639_21595 [Candidatus Acidiferrum sp.]